MLITIIKINMNINIYIFFNVSYYKNLKKNINIICDNIFINAIV